MTTQKQLNLILNALKLTTIAVLLMLGQSNIKMQLMTTQKLLNLIIKTPILTIIAESLITI